MRNCIAILLFAAMTYQNKKLTINEIFSEPAISAKDNIPFSFLDEHETRQTKRSE